MSPCKELDAFMKIQMRRVICKDGERLVVLVGEDGVPLFYPTLYVTAELRGNALAVNTNVNALMNRHRFNRHLGGVSPEAFEQASS